MSGTTSMLDPRLEQHEKITEMFVYIQQLEHAVAELHSKISPDPHPLLVERFAEGSGDVADESREPGRSQNRSQASDDDADLLAEVFGAMSMEPEGGTEFHGPTATSEFLLKAYHQRIHRDDTPSGSLSQAHQPSPLDACPELFFLNVQFPSPPPGQNPPDMSLFLQFLPSWSSARQLLDNYLNNFSWLAMPIPSDDLQDIFYHFYPGHTPTNVLSLMDAHRLGALFMVFEIGRLMDLSRDSAAIASDAELFHLLARAALASDPITEHTTVTGIQAMMLMIWFFRLYPRSRLAKVQWGLSGYLMRLVEAIGLHRNSRDSSQYFQDPAKSLKFEQTFWEYNAMDIWQSFMFGRPTSMTNDMILCQHPSTVHVHTGLDPQFYLWKYSFASVVSKIIIITSSRTVRYNDVLACEKELLDHYVPPSLEWPTGNPASHQVPGRIQQRCNTWLWKELSMMYIHRPYFWSAISKHPEAPHKSEFWHSVLMAYKSAATLVSYVQFVWTAQPRVIERFPPVWLHAQSAALILAALVIHSPSCTFAPEAMRRFEETYKMLLEAKGSYQPADVLTSMQKLRVKAHRVFSAHNNPQSGTTSIPEPPEIPIIGPVMDSLQPPHL
ncbi:hypothetical protein M422DRAFT_27068 [Sphaerobolus stellatus SS14]|nr:hypothetical protein M422DRAFT_27068 [Sphaerobolus stellatus SS14]